jgi:hypothetical protein
MKAKKQANQPIKPRRRKLSSARANDRVGVQNQGKRAYSEDGVDLTLIRWMLNFTPEQRLQVAQQSVRSIEEMRNASRGN